MFFAEGLLWVGGCVMVQKSSGAETRQDSRRNRSCYLGMKVKGMGVTVRVLFDCVMKISLRCSSRRTP